MKVNVHELKYSFGFEFVAETVEDAAWITRFQLNVKRQFPFISASASQDGEFRQWVSFDRKVEERSTIKA